MKSAIHVLGGDVLKECRFCKDKTKCEFAMNDYPGSGDLWKAEKYCEKIQKNKSRNC